MRFKIFFLDKTSTKTPVQQGKLMKAYTFNKISMQEKLYNTLMFKNRHISFNVFKGMYGHLVKMWTKM